MRIHCLFVIWLGCLGVVGCAALWEPAGHGVGLETSAPPRAAVADIHLYRMDEGLLVTGQVGVRSMATRLNGYVEVVVTDPDGQVVMRRRPDHYLYSARHEEIDQRYDFSVRLPVIPEAGSVIHVEYHADGGH
jgi:hypothetical protein